MCRESTARAIRSARSFKVLHKEKGRFAAHLKQIWLEPDKKSARRAAAALIDDYEKRFPEVDKKRISSTNGGSLDRLHELTAQAAN